MRFFLSHVVTPFLTLNYFSVAFLIKKGSVPLRPGEKIRKFVKILFIVWSRCVLQCINSFMKKIPMFKTEYLSSYTFLSEWGYCVYIDILLRLGPTPTFRALKKCERSDVTFSYTHL